MRIVENSSNHEQILLDIFMAEMLPAKNILRKIARHILPLLNCRLLPSKLNDFKEVDRESLVSDTVSTILGLIN